MTSNVGHGFLKGASVPSSTDALTLLKDAGPSEYVVTGGRRRNGREASLSREGLFVIFSTIPHPTAIKRPVEWNQDPFQSRSWRAQLHTLRFLDVLFSRYRDENDVSALRSACDITLDWVVSNARNNPEVSEMAWFDKVVGDRAPYIGYLLRAAASEEVLADEDLMTLFNTALEHIDFLGDESQYVSSSNHGLYQDVGLVLLSAYLDFLPAAEGWRQRGIRRFLETLSEHIAGEGEGIYLEHSPSYQWLIVSLVRRFRQLAGAGNDQLESLQSIQSELEVASGWLVLPNGQTPPLGDSDIEPAPSWARDAGRQAQGMKLFRSAGIAAVRKDSSMLITSAGYHTHAHKHADELGFCLFEQGELLLAEAGKYGYDDMAPARQYAVSSMAHNVLIVDNQNFSPRGQSPYGGALTRVDEDGGWYVVEGTNPLLREQNVIHRRLFIYKPGTVLTIIDRVESSERHSYTRLFHFGVGASAKHRSDGSLSFRLGAIKGVLSDQSASDVKIAVRKGQRKPVLAGWSWPKYRDWQSVPTVSLEAEQRDATLVTVIAVGDESEEMNAPAVARDAMSWWVEG